MMRGAVLEARASLQVKVFLSHIVHAAIPLPVQPYGRVAWSGCVDVHPNAFARVSMTRRWSDIAFLTVIAH